MHFFIAHYGRFWLKMETKSGSPAFFEGVEGDFSRAGELW